MTVLILHGVDGYAGVHWQNWLQKELLKRGFTVLMPELPNPGRPSRSAWLKAVKKAIKNVDHQSLVIVGHSLGVVTGLDLVESIRIPIKAFISVSGFGEDYGAELNSYFLKEKEINFDKVKKKVSERYVIYGDDDPYVPQERLEQLAKNLDVEPFLIKKGGHLNSAAGYTQFPVLIRIIENLNR